MNQIYGASFLFLCPCIFCWPKPCIQESITPSYSGLWLVTIMRLTTDGPFADLWWDIKCVLSGVRPRVPAHHPSSLTSDTAALITHPCRHCSVKWSHSGVKTLSTTLTLMLLTELLVTCLRTKFEWWNLRTFVFIEKVLANDHIIYFIYITVLDIKRYIWIMGKIHIICFKCQGKYAFTGTGLLSCQFYFNSTNYKKPQIVTDLLNIGPSKPLPRSSGRE